MKKVSTGIIYRLFKDGDKDTIIRKTNIRTFCQQKSLDYIISQGKMLVDIPSFLNTLNPKHYKANKTFPRLRTKISAQNEWNAHHRTKIKHHIIDCICNSGKINIYKHGRTNIINYDQFEKELIETLKQKGKY